MVPRFVTNKVMIGARLSYKDGHISSLNISDGDEKMTFLVCYHGKKSLLVTVVTMEFLYIIF